ncbi:tripartite tricarboxylate transporter substrate binding protein [Roseiarcaceae bacterium H3SJ34-1]|uniref:Bug family tripartite tricarboxylate transporter substrate binding protein n=1 Tax=Terripilifer ovatus TaxID=3032367 RepID=UPI003AB99AD1|nr:tripartite tricarboxylate transporter substrate binding protein [Roseiarcaceae bacterium H3SJ34-1]
MAANRRDFMAGIAGTALAGSIPVQAFAQQSWPNQPVKVIVTQAAGGTPDIVCRMVCERLSRALGQQFVVENRPGAGNVIGAQAVARAAPDGYTLLWATAASLITNVFTVKSLPYDPQKDFITIARIAKGPFIVVANPNVRANTFRDLIALAKAKPGELNFATDGPRNFSGMVAAWINKNAGVDIKQVFYSTMPQGVQDVLGDRVQLAILAIPTAAPLIAAGKLKALAISSAQRAPGFETIAPMTDTIPGIDFYGWFALSAPTGTPRPVIERLNAETSKILDDPGFAKPLADIGFYSFGSHSQAAADKAVRDEFEFWRKLVGDIGLEPA